MTVTITDFLVKKDDLHQTRFAERALPALQDGEVLLRVDRFAFTANNITYAVMGESMAYWQFFPASDAGYGRIPVWGFADVLESRCAGITVGERLYGYLPMSTHLVIAPGRVSEGLITDAVPHRAALPSIYNTYNRVLKDPSYDPKHEAEQALLRPLFTTSFLIEDFLSHNDHFGATAVVLSSASSKTAIGVAHQLKQRGQVQVIGLTSPGNAAFVERTGCYDLVLPYAKALQAMPATQKTVFVDFSGNGQLLHDIHHHFDDALVYSCLVGGTHWDQRATQHALPGAKPTFFFAPTQAKKRSADWGPGGVESRVGAAWRPFLSSATYWLEVTERFGTAQMALIYDETLSGKTVPDRGYMLAF
ncbi:MAG: DUF2855 family protein [Pseudomonadota bacterium]